MNEQELPLIPNRKAFIPTVYGDTPSFLGVPVSMPGKLEKGTDIVFAGIPWEGSITWGSYSGCELAPRTIRHCSARYGGFLPEYDINLFDFLKVVDIGDIPVCPNEASTTMKAVFEATRSVYRNKSIPFFVGGDHSTTPEMVRALGDTCEGDIGIVHLDAHLDNSRSFGDDALARCTPLFRISQNAKVRTKSIAHVGIRGPRNSVAQFQTAKEMGARIYSILDIRKQGVETIAREAFQVASEKTRHVFVTVCSDCVDAFSNPGGPADFNGMLPGELFTALFELGRSGIAGLDFVEVYPKQDPESRSSHLACWAIIYALAGIASRKREMERQRAV